jgi:large subunit ribosomal protein L4
LKNLGLTNQKVVVVLEKNDEQLKKSFRNVEGVKYLLVNYLNPFDIMNADKILFTENSLQELQK